MKYAVKKYSGPKIDKIRLKFSPFYRHYLHWLYVLGKLPYKNQYEPKSSEYYKQRQDNLNIMEEFSFIAKHHIKSTDDLKICELWFEKELEYKKGTREELYVKLKKASIPEEKLSIKNEIGFLTHEINHDANELKVCRRFMWRLNLLQQEDAKLRNLKQAREEITYKTKNDIVR